MATITVEIEPTLKNLREHKGLSQKEMASRVGLDVGRYNMLEHITPSLMLSISKVLGVKPEDIKLVV